MGTSDAQITAVRGEIDRSRSELFHTVGVFEHRLRERKEELVDRVSPSRVWHRKTAGIRQRWDDVSSTISGMSGLTSSGTTAGRTNPMVGSGSKIRGQAQELSGRAGDAVSSVGDQTRGAAPALRERTEHNPMAAGLVALGAGFLAAALLPPSERERQAAQRLRQELEPLRQQASVVGREMAGELQQVAETGVDQLKERATEAVEQVKQETQSSARQVKEEATTAGTKVKKRASSASRQVKEEASTDATVGSASRPMKKKAAAAAAPTTKARRSPRRAPIRAGAGS